VRTVRTYVTYVRDDIDRLHTAFLELDRQARAVMGSESLSQESVAHLVSFCGPLYSEISRDIRHAIDSIEDFREDLERQQ
jgi:hypothetical protein